MNAKAKRAVSYTPIDAAKRSTSAEDALAIMDAMRDRGISSIAAGRVYLLIAVHGPQNIGQISRALGLPMSTASRMAYELFQLGLFSYQPGGVDRRIRKVELA